MTHYCPFCYCQPKRGEVVRGDWSWQPVLSPLRCAFVAGVRSSDAQPYAKPHWLYLCARCGHAEIHDAKLP